MSRLGVLFPGASEMAQRMRAFDWSASPVGDVQHWSQSLRLALRICLTSRLPMNLWWGPSLTFFYNDAFIPLLGPRKHPAALGQSGADVWSEVWDAMGPMVARVFAQNVASGSDDVPMFFDRALPREEMFLTFSLSPITGFYGTVEGVFAACADVTGKIVRARRLETLRRLVSEPCGAKTLDESWRAIGTVLMSNRHDLPFAAVYLFDSTMRKTTRVLASGLDAGRDRLPAVIDCDGPGDWGFERVARTRQMEEVSLDDGIPAAGGPWDDPVTRACVLPLCTRAPESCEGLLVAGLSTRRPFDADYRDFLRQVATHIADEVADRRASEAERERSDALAAIDRTRTEIFSDVSHELRAPLTLMIGPLEDELRESPDGNERVRLAHRHAVRLLKLVNTLLDLSRLEARRMEVRYEETDLGEATRDLASLFRSAIEDAGMRLNVACEEPLPRAYVDRDMWEKIVVNLIGNAFKHTFEGQIDVVVRARGDEVDLIVGDTGVGIPAAELPRIFERFHRVAVRSRHHGTGIGLAVVEQFVKLHGGAIHVSSTEGRGTTFVVTIPLGHAHLPPGRVARPGRTSEPEPSDPTAAAKAPAPAPPLTPTARRSRIVLADDDPDVRAYVTSLLEPIAEVTSVGDGEEAWRALCDAPADLVLSDLRMPKLDGPGLLARLRGDARLSAIPFVLVSARAGEDARVAGLDLGADGYIEKPFSPRELRAQVRTLLELSSGRRAVEDGLRRDREELEQRVADRTLQLRRAHAGLERRVAKRTEELAVANSRLEGELGERRLAEEQVKALFKRIVTAQETERQRVAREVHDQLGQTVTALRMTLQSLLDGHASDQRLIERAG